MGRPSPFHRVRAMALVALVLTGSIAPHAAVAAAPEGPPSPEKAKRLSALWTFVPFGAGLAVALSTNSEVAQNLGGALAASGLEAGPLTGYEYAKIAGKGAWGVVGRTVILIGTGIWANSIDENGFNSEGQAFAVAATGLVVTIFWAAHDIRRVGPLVEAKNATSWKVEVGPGLGLAGTPMVGVRARF
jgi:hypothetical protein